MRAHRAHAGICKREIDERGGSLRRVALTLKRIVDAVGDLDHTVGVGLAFTPVVMSEGRISLKVSTEVSELTNDGAVRLSGFFIPALKVRRAETMMELPSGGSLVMAGLLSDQSKQALSGFPGLKNIPVLGALFRSRDYLKNETELVIIVTPYVVNPAARQQLAQPDDGFGWASDVNSDVIGQMNRVYGRHPERAPVGRFDGDVGFIVE